MRIVEKVARRGEWTEGDVQPLELRAQRLGRLCREFLSDDRHDLLALPRAQWVRLQVRIGKHLLDAEPCAEAPPVIVAGDADEHGLAVRRLEWIVHGPRARLLGHWRRRFARQ